MRLVPAWGQGQDYDELNLLSIHKALFVVNQSDQRTFFFLTAEKGNLTYIVID
jgi:hypothetical protein